MTLAPSAPGTDAELRRAQSLRRRLRDMELNQGQLIPQLVQSEDGRLYLAYGATSEHFSQPDDYPLLAPLNPLPAADLGRAEIDALDISNAAALSHLEDIINGYGRQNLSDPEGRLFLARANVAGILPAHPFQVVWLGSRRRWWIAPGSVTSYNENGTALVRSFDKHTLAQESGWLVLPFTLRPVWTELSGGSHTCTVPSISPPVIVDQPVQSPPVLTWSVSGVLNTPSFVEHVEWTEGSYQFPIAYVEPPGHGHQAPLIRPILRADLTFDGPDFLGSLPAFFHPFTIP